jgi:oligopeptide transport system ATP-binding protein
MSALLAVEHLVQHFRVRGGMVHAVEDVSFTIGQGEVVGLVGESGSGKTTIGQAILRLADPTGGRILFRGQDITALPERRLMPFRRQAQPIFQDPYGSLNPRMSVEDLIAEPLIAHGIGENRRERRKRIVALLDQVGLSSDHLTRHPHQFSGGQRQRIAIARALAVEPALVIADEPVSALDVSIQAQIVNLMRELQRKLGLAMLFIAHDLAVVEYISDRIVVLYLGRVMETGPARALIGRPRHPYTEALISAVPEPSAEPARKRIVLEGDLPSPISPPSGCVFRTRCPYALPACGEAVPALREVAKDHAKACIRDDIL